MKTSIFSTHILIVVSSLNVAGGLERMVVGLANKLVLLNYKVSLLIVSNDKGMFYTLDSRISTYLLDVNFGINSPTNYFRRKVNFIQSILRFRKMVNQIKPDILINTEYPFNVASLLGRLNSKTKIISWQHSSFYQKRSTLWRLLTVRALRGLNCIVCLNKDEEYLYKRYNKQTVVIPNFIEVSKVRSGINNKVILTIARLDFNKGIDMLMQVVKLILDKYTDWHWIIIGDGELKRVILEFIQKNNYGHRLVLKQAISDNIEVEYRNASLYVSTSRAETFGMVFLEAMNHGVPCISFNCDTGPRHIIHNNIDGLLVENEQSIKLAKAIESLITNDQKRKQMGEAAYINVQRFSSEIIIKKWEALFQRLLSPPTKS